MGIKVYNVCTKMATWIAIAILALLTLISAISTTCVDDSDQVSYAWDRPWLHVIVISLLLALLCLIYKKTKFRITDRTLIVALTVMTAATAAYITVTNLQPRFDQQAVRGAAGYLLYGITDDYLPGGYAEASPQQNGLILLYMFILGKAGYDNYIVIQYFNLACMVLTEIVLYLIFKNRTRYFREIMLGMILFLPYWLYANFLYGNIPGLLLALMGTYFAMRFVEGLRIRYALICGICLSLACIIKMNFIILSALICCVALMETIRDRKYKRLWLIAVVFILYLSGNKFTMHATEAVVGHRLTGGIPSISFVAMGLHEQTSRGAGWYDGYTRGVYEEAGYDTAKAAELAKQDISKSIDNFKTHPKYMAGFFARKICSVWGEPTYYSWAEQQGRDAILDEILYYPFGPYVTEFMNLMQTILYAFAFLYLVYHRNDGDLIRLFFAIYLIGGFVFHLLWEAHSQYALPYALLITPYSTVGLIDTAKWLSGFAHRPFRWTQAMK